MEKIIKAIELQDLVGSTRSFIVFSGSKEDEWRGITQKLYCSKDDSFFIGTTNEYNRDCGWYLKYEEHVKPLLKEIYNKILDQSNYKYMAYMMDNYNRIIEHVKSEIDVDLPTLKKCNLDSCIFKIDNNCCNANQEYVTVNNLECDKFIQSDYYEALRDLKRQAENKINKMNLNELESFLSE